MEVVNKFTLQSETEYHPNRYHETYVHLNTVGFVG